MMDRLISEWQRLFFLPEQRGGRWSVDEGHPGAGPSLDGETERLTAAVLSEARERGQAMGLWPVDAAGRVKVLCIGFSDGDWAPVASLWQAIQEDLDWPAPAVAIAGERGLQLWLPLAEPVPVEQAQALLAGLAQQYLAEVLARIIALVPTVAAPALLPLPPSPLAGGERWSAFIDPSLGGMFGDEPWLELPPNPEKQADLLAGVSPVPVDAFAAALARLTADGEASTAASPVLGDAAAAEGLSATLPSLAQAAEAPGAERLAIGGGFRDPRDFLLAVMNEPSASARWRIEAAKALMATGAGKTTE